MLPKQYVLYSKSAIPRLFKRHLANLDAEAYVAAAHVFPMRTNNHVTEDLIDWTNLPFDPMFQLNFPQPQMLPIDHLRQVSDWMKRPDISKVDLRALCELVRRRMNPHPAGQKKENVPMLDGWQVPGLQHKYRETVLFFPSEGQYCHAYCTYCFRWAQFTSVGSDQTFKSADATLLKSYLLQHPQVKDVLFTGGDPMVMPAWALEQYVQPLIEEGAPMHLDTIRIGTKSLAWWPYRYVTDRDASEVLRLFSRITAAGKQLALQAHFSHPRELEHPVAQEAIRLIRMTGAQIRSQSPLIKHVNKCADLWTRMWNVQVRLGIVPYYMFVERDTGASAYFSVPLTEALGIYNAAYSRAAGTARTVRGPSMSASPGKVCVVGETAIQGERYFVLKFLQARNPAWCDRVFLARHDPSAVWFDELKPAFGEAAFFFEQQYTQQKQDSSSGSSGQLHYQWS